MSWKATSYVDGLEKGLTRSQKLLMFVIADHYNDEQGWAWPSVGRLATKAMLSESQVYRLVADLEKKDLLEVEHNGGRTSNRYRFPGLDRPPVTMTPPRMGARAPLASDARLTVKEPLTEDEPQQAAEVYDQLVRDTGTASSVQVPSRYWRDFEGEVGAQDRAALDLTIGFANWLRQKEDPPLQLPTFAGGLERIGKWMMGRRISRAAAEDAVITLYQKHPKFSAGVGQDRMLLVLNFFPDEFIDLVRAA